MSKTIVEVNSLAIVTGASSGLGAAFARRLTEQAASGLHTKGLPMFSQLWLVARREDRLVALAAELRLVAPDLVIETVVADITMPGSIEALASRAMKTGSVSILINNAGFGTYGNFDDTTPERSLGQVDLNCRALTESLARFSPLLASGSLVINVASLASFAPLGGFAVYAASKAYALSLSVALSAEWKKRGISVCALCPGPVATEFSLVASNGARKDVLHGWSAQRTVELCLRDAGRGRSISMPRALWRFRRFAGWLFGPSLSASFTYRFMKRPSAPTLSVKIDVT